MDSRVFLTFKDPETLSEYNKKRHPEILKISLILLAERTLFFFVLLINNLALSASTISARRLILGAVVLSVHIALLLSLKLKFNFLYTIHGPLLAITHLLHILNLKLAED